MFSKSYSRFWIYIKKEKRSKNNIDPHKYALIQINYN